MREERNPIFEFSSEWLTPERKKTFEILEKYGVKIRSLSSDVHSFQFLRIYVPQKNDKKVIDLLSSFFAPDFRIVYVDSYPHGVDKYCLEEE